MPDDPEDFEFDNEIEDDGVVDEKSPHKWESFISDSLICLKCFTVATKPEYRESGPLTGMFCGCAGYTVNGETILLPSISHDGTQRQEWNRLSERAHYRFVYSYFQGWRVEIDTRYARNPGDIGKLKAQWTDRHQSCHDAVRNRRSHQVEKF